MENYLKATSFLDFDHPNVQQFVAEQINGKETPTEKAIALYYAVRENWWYYPYEITIDPNEYSVSALMKKKKGHCIAKAAMLIACCRAAGIPSRLRLARVRNHIAAEKFQEKFGTDILSPHGIAEVYLEGKWVKCTPAFNAALCEKLNVAPLEFDGKTDSVFQEFDNSQNHFMEYIEDLGDYEDIPVEHIMYLFFKEYPILKPYFKTGKTIDIAAL